jgi:hypothetical protein
MLLTLISFFVFSSFYLLTVGAEFIPTLDHTQTHHTRQYSSRRGIGPSQRPLPDNTTLTTDIHAPGGIRTRNPCKEAAVDPRLRQCGHWDRLAFSLPGTNILKHVPRQLKLCSPLLKCDQVPYPYKTADESERTRDRLKGTEKKLAEYINS